MMTRISPLLTSVMALSLLSFSAQAMDGKEISHLKVRGSDKSGYSRLVFDWGAVSQTPNYTTKNSDGLLTLTFDKAQNFSGDGMFPQSLSRVTNYKIISPTQLQISFIAGQNIRHFIADNKLVIDIKGQAEKVDIKKPDIKNKSEPIQLASKIETAAGDNAKEIKPEIKPEEKNIIESLKSEKNIIVDEEKSAEVEKSAEKSPDIVSQAYTISITSMSSIPLAVFERNGYLWIAQGKENVKIPPQISGKGSDGLPPFQPILQDGISVFRMKVPSGLGAVAKGGGLAWKIDLTDKQPSKSDHLTFQKILKDEQGKNVTSLLWPAPSSLRVVQIKDPDVGDVITVGMVEQAKDFLGLTPLSYVDFDTLPTIIGLALIPKVDDLNIAKVDEGISISREGGLRIASDRDVTTATQKPQDNLETANNNLGGASLFDFASWQIGTEIELPQNQRLMMLQIGEQTDTRKAETLINLGKLCLSFNYAPEAIGYLELAQSLVPEIESNPEFIALMGAAQALSWKQKEGLKLFNSASLNDIPEIGLWKSFTLAKLDDWQQAAKTMPADLSPIKNYTPQIKIPFALTMLEIALREGNIARAKEIIEMLEPYREKMALPYASAYDYLLGEQYRQTQKLKETKEIWKGLTDGKDDLYRSKSRFALTEMQLASKEITEDKAIDNLEGLRYAWRGDDLEVSINHNLAEIYLKKGEPVKALNLMKLAYSLNPQSEQGKKIDAEMRSVFQSLFSEGQKKPISPVDMLVLYNEYSNLIPAGEAGEQLTRQLADRMASADLLPRAIAIIKKQVDAGLKGAEGAAVIIRLATLQNMDGKPDDALAMLDKAEAMLVGLPSEDVIPRQTDIGLLRAKSYSLKGNTDDAFSALALLPQTDDSLKLKADIAWRGKKWQDAADSLEQLVQNQNINLTKPLTDEQGDLLLNWGVALYLADNRYVLANLRERYSDAMSATTKAQKFEVVTRPRQGSLLADRETINSIIDEASIFKDFLKSFRATDAVAPLLTPPTVRGDTAKPVEIPESLRNVPGIKADEVLGD